MSSYGERQEDEVEFLQAVFPNPGDFQDLRNNDPWKIHRPPEILLTLVPQKSMGGSNRDERPVSIKLHTKYPTDYPDSVPTMWLEEPQGITPDQVKELEGEIKKMAEERVGEVMMLDIAMHMMAFLYKHDRPLVSLHQEMVMRQKEEEKRKEQLLEEKKLENRMREMEEEMEIQEEIRRKEAEIMIQDSDEDFYEHNSSADESGPIRPAPLLSVTPSLPNSNWLSLLGGEQTVSVKDRMSLLSPTGSRKPQRNKMTQIKKGKLLGESMTGGYSVHVGMDLENGELLAVYEWHFQFLKKDARRAKQIDSIQQEFESFISRGLCQCTRLVQHLDMTTASEPDSNHKKVELVMEYVGGGNVGSLLRNPDSSPITGSRLTHYSKQLLEALSCLHSKGIVHNDICPSVIFFDNGGSIKLGGSNIIKRLSDLHWALTAHDTRQVAPPTDNESAMRVWPVGSADLKGGKKGDILRLGMILLCLATGKLEINYPPSIPEHLPPSLKDFLAKCVDTNEQRRFPAHELLHHPFITPSPSASLFTSSSSIALTTHTKQGAKLTQKGPMHFQRSDSIFGSPLKPSFMGKSRLETEFEELEVLGSGGFGDVIKVRHYLDARIYAIKRIQTKSDSRIMNRITREVELLSQMNHENVVRYYNAWIETYTDEDFKRHSLEDDKESSSESELESETENEQFEGSSIEFQNETSSGESFESDSDDDESIDLESDSFQSAEEDVIFNNEEDSFITFEKSPSSKVRTSSHGGDKVKSHNTEEDGVFMDNFSDSSEDTDEGRNVLGKLESQVMDLSLSRFRLPTTESSDTVVFVDSSTTASKPVAMEKNERRKDRRKSKSSGQTQFLYIQMEYCENETLRQLIDSGELHVSEDKVWRLFREIVEGLEHIHSKGMIHRDLKPGNIFLNSSGHIKIGDFGLAISYKHPINKQISSVANQTVNLHDGETGLVGTAMYMAPELLKQLKYTQKVDTYSLGIIFFEMCHAPSSTAMERHKILRDIRQPSIIFPPSFITEKVPNQAKVIRLLLNHNPHERPSSKQLLQSPLLPLKMEDEELQEVVLRTLQATNSTRYRHLINQLFAHEHLRVSEFSYFLDPQDNSRRTHAKKFAFHTVLLQQLIHSRLVNVFMHHGASSLSPPLLSLKGALFSETDSVAQLMDRNGTVVVLPHDHRIPFARYICHQGISYLKRYCIAPVFRENRVRGCHPKEHYEYQFDIVSPSPGSLIPDAEVMYVVSEIINEIPGLQDLQLGIHISHTSLLSSILSHCSIPEERHVELQTLLHKVLTGSLKSCDLIKKLAERKIRLSPLAATTLLKFVRSEVLFESRDSQLLLEPLLKDKSAEITSQSSHAYQEISNVVGLFRQFGAKEQVYLCPGLSHGASHFSGVIFQFVDTSSGTSGSLRRYRRSKRIPLAIGGRYDKLLETFRRPGQQLPHPGVSVVGVTLMSDVLLTAVLNAYQQETCQITKCSVLVCWLGRESLQKESLGLVRDLWAQGISADILYESMEKDNIEDIQKFCREVKIPHIVILGDKTLYFERKQVKLRILESSKVMEKSLTINELMDFLQQKHHHTVERSDSTELKEPMRSSGSYISEGQSTAVPQVNITVVTTGKLTGHLKRRYHDQTLNKLLPLFQKFSMKQQLEVVVVDLKSDILCSLAAEVNKLKAGNDSDFLTVARAVSDRHSDCNKKYIARICDAMDELLNYKKKSAVVFLYSHSAEFCQVVLNSLESFTAI